MAGADSKLELPGDFTAGKTYLVKGETLLAWRAALIKDRVLPGPGQTETQTEAGRMFTTTAGVGGSGSGSSGAFCGQYVQDGDTILQGGTITGGHGGEEAIDDYVLIASGDTPPIADSGDVLYLKCNVTATMANGMMLPGLLLNSATLTKTLPTMHAFTTAALTGDIFIEIGRWNDTAFLSAGNCGLSRAGGCAGNYQIGRATLD